MKKIINFIKVLFENMQFRFLFVGGLNTLVGYGLYTLLIFMKLHYFLAVVIGGTITVAHSYIWNKYFTFQINEWSYREIMRFVSVYFVSIGINTFLLYLAIDQMKMNAYFAGGIGMIITTVISYFGHKLVSFKRTEI